MSCSMKDLTNKTCKWPIGDPQEDDFKFCGAKSDTEESSYCEFHTKMAYRTNYVSRSQKQKEMDKKLKKAA